MPTFMDRHRGAEVPQDKLREMESDVRSGKPDRHGVVTRAVLMDHRADEMICITEGPNEEAIRKHHEAEGIPVGDLRPVDAIL